MRATVQVYVTVDVSVHDSETITGGSWVGEQSITDDFDPSALGSLQAYAMVGGHAALVDAVAAIAPLPKEKTP